MDRVIAACGNDCVYCPRYTVHPYEKTAAKLQQTAELWMKIGYRDHIVSNEEIACSGCRAENWCRYHVVKCCEEKGIKTCAECQAYPCENLRECFEVTKSFEPMCRRVCSEEEYEQLKKAFFEKEKNLSKLARGLKNDADRTDYTGDKNMDNYVDERDSKLLDQDKYTFFVLRRVMSGQCELLLSDHEKLIICFTSDPFPVWIWTPDDASPEDMERAYQTAKEHGLMHGNHHFNLKYALADYFIQRAAKEDVTMTISENMFAYDCPDPIAPSKKADGEIHLCQEADLEELTDMIEMFHEEINLDIQDRERYRRDAGYFISTGKMYFWKNAEGRHVACCKYAPNGEMASINAVFTRPEFRRRHYAENLVYQVTKKAKDAGFIPMLYTDADYAASNACYEKIGYVLRGKLCTIG